MADQKADNTGIKPETEDQSKMAVQNADTTETKPETEDQSKMAVQNADTTETKPETEDQSKMAVQNADTTETKPETEDQSKMAVQNVDTTETKPKTDDKSKMADQNVDTTGIKPETEDKAKMADQKVDDTGVKPETADTSKMADQNADNNATIPKTDDKSMPNSPNKATDVKDSSTSKHDDVDGVMVRSLSDDVFLDASKSGSWPTLAKSDSVASSLSTISTLTTSTGDSDGSLIIAAREFDIKTIKVLLKSDDISANQTSRKGYTALHEMIKTYAAMNIVEKMLHRKHLEEVIIALREKGLEVNAVDHGKKKQTALHIIAEYDGNDDVIKILLAVGMRVNLANGAGETALHKAVSQVSTQNAEALLQAGADPNIPDNRGLTPLHLASKGPRHFPILQLLIKCGGNTERADKGGRYPLHIAAKAGRADLVRELLIGGANTNCQDSSGQTPLHLAAAHDVTGTVIRELLDRPSTKLNLKDTIYGETALHKIVRFQRMENLKVLAKQGVNVNAQDFSGNTALHKASHCSNIMLWKTLLSLQGDVKMLNDSYATPVMLATKAKNHVALAMINQYSANEE